MGFLDRLRKDSTPPKADTQPRGASGRGHTAGFVDYEETNHELRHPHGHKIYDQMYRTDGDVRQVVSLVTNPIISGTWQVAPHGGEHAENKAIEVADIVKWALWDVMEPNLLGHLQTALPVLVRSGFVPFEEAWTTADRDGKTYICPRTMGLRLPSTIEQFEQDVFGQLTRIKQYLRSPISSLVAREGQPSTAGLDGSDAASYGGVWLDAKNLVYYRVGAEGDNWEGVSMLRPAYKHWKLKSAIEKIDAVAQEREALGIPICYPPLGATDAQLDEMENVLANMRMNEQSYIIAPGPKQGAGSKDGQGWLIEVLGYDRTGSGRDPHPSLEYHTQKIAAAFISEFMRLGHGSTGARATAQVQQDPFLMSVEALTHVVEDVLNDQLVKPFVLYNFGPDAPMPRLQMSLVDSTSLSQLADYILKLTQVGALIPDQELEDFLRARGDLPPSNPETIKRRKGKKDDEYREEIVKGTGGNGDAFGQNADPGKPHGNKNATKAAGSGDRGASHSHDDEETVTLSYLNEETGRYYRREPRDYETSLDLVGMEDAMDRCSDGCYTHLQEHLLGYARGLDARNGFADHLETYLSLQYDHGRSFVAQELGLTTLDRGAVERGRKGVRARAEAGAAFVKAAMDDARINADLIHGDDNPAHAQLAAETAGAAAAKRVGRAHGIGSFLQGRHDMALDAGDRIVGVRYSAILDRSTCASCEAADDGVVRDLDDPVRLDRRPPNRHCHSTAGGVNMCRCFEIYVTKSLA